MRISNDLLSLAISETPSIENIRANAGSDRDLQYRLSQALEEAGKHFDHVVTAVRGNHQYGEAQNFKNKFGDMDQSQGTANSFRLQDYMSDYSRMQGMLSNILKKVSDTGDGVVRNLR
jgi:hypothetical protein